jgi:peptidyl-prolyl cis-trans isomerase C
LAQVIEQLKEGRDFADVSKDFTEKSDLGVVGRGQLKKDLEDVLFSLEPGVVSKPVAAGEGHYIFLVQERLPASKKSLEEVKDSIMVMLEDQKTEKMLKEWLEALKEKAYISIRE